MKEIILVLLVATMLAGCGSASIQSTVTATTTVTETLTITPSYTPRSTSTPKPTITATPMLPSNIEWTVPETISQFEQNKIVVMMDKAYWFYVKLGCSPNGYKIKFYDGPGGYSDYANGAWMEVGITEAGLKSDFIGSTGAVSHEMAHTMCQHQFTRRGNLGSLDLRWLTEGVANYFSSMEQIARNGGYGGISMSVKSWEKDALNANMLFCSTHLSALEPSNAHEKYPKEYWTVSVGATVFLAKTTPEGIKAVISYYKLLSNMPNKQAFAQAFGRSKEDFYRQYNDECSKGFPSVK